MSVSKVMMCVYVLCWKKVYLLHTIHKIIIRYKHHHLQKGSWLHSILSDDFRAVVDVVDYKAEVRHPESISILDVGSDVLNNAFCAVDKQRF